MADDTREIKMEVADMTLEDSPTREEADTSDTFVANGSPKNGNSQSSTPPSTKLRSRSPTKKEDASISPKSEQDEDEKVVGGDITVTVDPGKPPKLSRKSSQKVVSRAAPLFLDLPDVKEEATSVFQCIRDCIYGSKYMGASEHDALDCDCSEQWSACPLSQIFITRCADGLQMMARTKPVGKIRTVSIARPKWNASMATATVGMDVKIRGFNSDNTLMFP